MLDITLRRKSSVCWIRGYLSFWNWTMFNRRSSRINSLFIKNEQTIISRMAKDSAKKLPKLYTLWCKGFPMQYFSNLWGLPKPENSMFIFDEKYWTIYIILHVSGVTQAFKMYRIWEPLHLRVIYKISKPYLSWEIRWFIFNGQSARLNRSLVKKSKNLRNKGAL
jgi:hypothetical protein